MTLDLEVNVPPKVKTQGCFSLKMKDPKGFFAEVNDCINPLKYRAINMFNSVERKIICIAHI